MDHQNMCPILRPPFKQSYVSGPGHVPLLGSTVGWAKSKKGWGKSEISSKRFGFSRWTRRSGVLVLSVIWRLMHCCFFCCMHCVTFIDDSVVRLSENKKWMIFYGAWLHLLNQSWSKWSRWESCWRRLQSNGEIARLLFPASKASGRLTVRSFDNLRGQLLYRRNI